MTRSPVVGGAVVAVVAHTKTAQAVELQQAAMVSLVAVLNPLLWRQT
jgi:hypothetical protein